ncbi:MAG: HAD family phosphatase [Bacteroidota bacterium]
MAEPTIKNIIFDLGGVFLDVDYQKTKQAFVDLGIINFDDFYQQSFSNPLFAKLEKGLISPEIFYDYFREATGIPLSNQQIETAWNAMLGSFRKSSVAVLPILKQRYNTFLLSNTNAIHHKAFGEIHQREFGNTDFDDHFHKAYYSHLYHERKPETIAYEVILAENNLEKEETLFIDDTLKNINGALSAGIQVLFLENGALLEDVLKNAIPF